MKGSSEQGHPVPVPSLPRNPSFREARALPCRLKSAFLGLGHSAGLGTHRRAGDCRRNNSRRGFGGLRTAPAGSQHASGKGSRAPAAPACLCRIVVERPTGLPRPAQGPKAASKQWSSAKFTVGAKKSGSSFPFLVRTIGRSWKASSLLLPFLPGFSC